MRDAASLAVAPFGPAMMAAGAHAPHLSDEATLQMCYYLPVEVTNQGCQGFMEQQIPGAVMMDQMVVGGMAPMQGQGYIDGNVFFVTLTPDR